MDLIKLDAIQGHAPRTEGEKYGKFPPKVLLPEILKHPRYKVEPAAAIDGRRKRRRKAKVGDEASMAA